MALANDDLPQLKKHFFESLAEAEAKRLPSAFAASALEQISKRFEAMQVQMDKRFETMTQRMDKFMQWSFATMVATGGFVVAVLKLWPPVLP